MSRNAELRRLMMSEMLMNGSETNQKPTLTNTSAGFLKVNAHRAYDEKRYAAAISLYTELINGTVGHKDLIELHDCRASAYSKSGKFDLALKDGKHMINLDRSDPRGYLRSAHAEQCLGQAEKGVRILEHAMKRVPVGEKHRLEVASARARAIAQQQVMYTKGTDPLQTLPQELLMLIMQYLSHRELVRYLRVSKNWKSWISSSDVMTEVLDTREANSTVTYTALKAALARLGRHPKRLALTRLSDAAAKLANSEIERWTRFVSLESLIIEDNKIRATAIPFRKLSKLKHILISPGVRIQNDGRNSAPMPSASQIRSPSQVKEIEASPIWQCPLESASILSQDVCTSHIPQRTALVGFFDSWPSTHGIRSLTFQAGCTTNSLPARCIFPRLEYLHIMDLRQRESDLDLSSYSCLKHVVFERVSVRHNLGLLLPALESFRWDVQEETVGLARSCMSGGLLKSLWLSDCQGGSVGGGYYVLSEFLIPRLDTQNMRFLCLRNVCSLLDLGTLCEPFLQGPQALHCFTQVEHFCFQPSSSDGLDDRHAGALMEMLPNLTKLDIEMAGDITGTFVSALIQTPSSKLRRIILRSCPRVSPDVQQWAGRRNVHVTLTDRSFLEDTIRWNET